MGHVSWIARKVLVGAVLLVAWCGLAQAEDTKLNDIIDAGVIRVGVAEFKPFVYKNPDTNQLEGLEIDAANELASSLGVKLELIEATWETIFAGLYTGKYDIVMSGSKRTLQRALAVAFTEPYVSLTEYAMVRADSGVTSWEDLDKDGNTICAVLGGAAHLTLTKDRPELVKNAEVTPFKNLTLCGNSVATGQSTGWIEDVVSISGFIEAHPDVDLKMIELPFATHGVGNGYAVEKGHQEFLNWLNLFISKMKNQGTYAELARKYNLPEGILVKGWGQM